MTLTHILIFALISVPFMVWVPPVWRPWGLLIGSLAAVAWLMNDPLLLVLTVALVVIVWWTIHPEINRSDDRVAIGIMAMVVVIVGLASAMLPFALMLGVAAVSASQMLVADRRRLALALIGLIVFLLVVVKLPGEPAVVWLGISYVAFRLMSLLLDYQAGRLPDEGFALRDVAVYVLFFPAYTAGPIDRAARFIPELQAARSLDFDRMVEGGGRIAVGVFKKFVVADSLALISMTPVLIEQTGTTAGLWLLVYVYAFQIFFDFSGYTDVAIGLGRLYGLTLPENFNRPYLQSNLQQFWQRWHITLSTWFRVYYFTPVSRTLIRSRYKLPQWGIVAFCQLTTMALIGLWHGITLNFLMWGLWHGVGLFAHKTLVDNTRGWYRRVKASPTLYRVVTAGGWLLTFHYVAVGWVFFALPDLDDSVHMLASLFGGI